MRIILSRKGFDSEFGGCPSPILPNGKMISLPIPLETDTNFYQNLKIEDGKTYYDLMKELGIKDSILKSPCHVDPDIYRDIMERHVNWKQLFGQMGSAQGHLKNKNIKPLDIFLFFGTFQRTKITKDEKLKFDSDDKPKHIIFGYLQIGKIIKNKKNVEEWMRYHPHYERNWNKNNTIYVAREKLSWNSNISGAGVFEYNKNLVLTAIGKSKSYWYIPILQKKKISYHNDASWKDGLFKSVGRGQEFVIEDNIEIEEWVKKLIEDNCNKGRGNRKR